MEEIKDMNGKEIRVQVFEYEENVFSLRLEIDAHFTTGVRGYEPGGEVILYSLTPETMAMLGLGIINTAARALATRQIANAEKQKEVVGVSG